MGRYLLMDSKILGANIRKYRLAKGLTQDQAAEMCGLTTNYFRQIELGNKTPQLKTFVRIADVLEATANNLLEGILQNKDEALAKDLVSQIYELPATKRKLVLSQLQNLLSSLNSL